METDRRIVSVWLPDFATDRLTRPRASFADWRDAPFATLTRRRGAVVLAAVNPAAREAGLAPGQGLADARALCPETKCAEADPAAELAALGRLARWCTRWSPWTSVESLGEDGGAGLWIDATGCAHLEGGEEALLGAIAKHLRAAGFAAYAAIADTPAAAWAAARFAIGSGHTAIVPEGAARQWLSGLPVAALRLPPATVATLHRLGLRRIGDLPELPRAPLAARFGPHLPHRLDQIAGRAPESIGPAPPELHYRARLGFAEPVGRVEDIAAALRRLLDALCRALERDRKGARRLELALYRVDGETAEIEVGTAAPARDPIHLARLFAERLETIDAGFGIEAVALAIPQVEPLEARQIAFAPLRGAERGREDLALLVDRLGQRLGMAYLTRQAARGSHVPERSITSAAPLGPLPAPKAPPDGSPPPRPLRLFAKPESIAALAPADTPAEAPPAAFRWKGRLHRVALAEGPERIAAEWWHAATPPPPSAFRDYWRIEDGEGRRFWLFRDAGQGGWFLHGLFA